MYSVRFFRWETGVVKWSRTIAFSADHSPVRNEIWCCHRDDGTFISFDVNVRVGKELDVLSLKGVDLAELSQYSAALAEMANRLYGVDERLYRQGRCACCGGLFSGEEKEVLRVFNAPYVRCEVCGHVQVPVQPRREILEAVFAESETHSSTYVDHSAIEKRLSQIVAPKIQWCLEQFSVAHSGKRPRSVIDVGAGGGHFLTSAARAGLSVDGFELSKASRAFAAEAFGIELRSEDFRYAECNLSDLVTFWGLLEYVPDPDLFIAAARRALAEDGLLIVEVPRVDSLSTAVQSIPGAVVARHMDPTSHINAFSDESLMTLLVEGGFKPVAAWYFGMDIYESLVQMALRLGNPTLLESLSDLIPRLQQSVDLGRQCDDLIVAAVPIG
jgi:2-polyprenyl-3-methyl-5-hydroxy-6-metoxy-1,4-benzoquinol methylase